MSNNHIRADRSGPTRSVYEKNRKLILATQDICAFCGKPVDKSLKYPDPWSATVDHIVPISRGGHPFDLGNLQLMHAKCNRLKWDREMVRGHRIVDEEQEDIKLSDLPWHYDWTRYRGETEIY